MKDVNRSEEDDTIKKEKEKIAEIMEIANDLASDSSLWWAPYRPFEYTKQMNAPFMHDLLKEVYKKGYYLSHDMDTFEIWVRYITLRRLVAYLSPVAYFMGLAWFTHLLAITETIDPLLFLVLVMWVVITVAEFSQTMTTTPRAMGVFAGGLAILIVAALGGARCWRAFHV